MAECKCKVKKVKKEKGFTIIEVALVLAIAGLIFLVVFLAVPALQRNQRDDARKRDVTNVVAAVTSYFSNSGRLNMVTNAADTTATGSVYVDGVGSGNGLGKYIDKLSGNVDYVYVYTTVVSTFPASAIATGSVTTATSSPKLNNMVIYQGAKCEGNTGLVAASKRQAAVVIQIEAGGDSKFYCQNAS